MSRANVVIRDAGVDDLAAVIALVDACAAADGLDSGVRRMPDGPGRRGRGEQMVALLGNPEVRVVLADKEDGTGLAGLMILTADIVSAALDAPAAYVHYLVVDRTQRHRGVGRALLAQATTFAEELGAEHVVVGVTHTARDTNRWFARLGFAPLVLRRVASVSALRRTLGMTEPVADLNPDVRRRLLSRHLGAMGRAARVPRARVRRPS